MPGVVGRVKRTPRFDARGGRKGKTDPQIRCSGYWIASLRSQWREERGAGLLYFVRNDGCEVGGLPRFARNDRERGLDCFASLAMTGGEGGWIALLRSQWRVWGRWIATLCSQWREEWGLDCFASLAMTGGEGCWIATLRSQWQGVGIGLLHFARNDGRRGCWIVVLRSQWREERGLDCHASLAMTGGEG